MGNSRHNEPSCTVSPLYKRGKPCNCSTEDHHRSSGPSPIGPGDPLSTRSACENRLPDLQVEILTVEEFAERMKVGRTTVFQWLKDGTLIQGRHYIKIGRVLRLRWPDVLVLIGEDNLQLEAPKKAPPPPRRPKNPRFRTNPQAAIDLEYG